MIRSAYLDLGLPEDEDYYDVEVFNENFETIEARIEELDNGLAYLGEEVSPVGYSGVYNDLLEKPFYVVHNVSQLSAAYSSVSGGGIIYLMPGTYDLTGGMEIGEGVTIMGSGSSTVVKLPANGCIKVVGRRGAMCNLTLTRTVESTQPLMLFDMYSGETAPEDFIMDRVYIDCVNANASEGFISSAIGVTGLRITNLTVNTDAAGGLITKNITASIYSGIISCGISNYMLTVPGGIQLGTNINIITE